MKTLKYILVIMLLSGNTQAQYIVNDAFKKITLEIPDITVSGPIGTAFETVDHFSSFIITQTTPNITLSLPAPTDTTWGDDVTIRNTGTTAFTLYGVSVLPDSNDVHLTWKRGAWKLVGGYGVGGGGGGSDCNCCDSLLFFPNDTAAHNQGWFNKGDYYLLSTDNSYGYAWGVIRKVLQDVGFIENTMAPPDAGAGLIVGQQEKVGFKGRSPRCKFLPPENTLAYYASDTDAKIDLTIGDFYMCSNMNVYGMPKGTIKKITEP